MDTILAKDEILIKQYDYASTKTKRDSVLHSLIVTDKRIILQDQGKMTFSRDEMPIAHADYVTTDFDSQKRSFALTVILFVISALLATGGFVWSRFVNDSYWFLIPTCLGAVCLIFAIIALICALKTKGAFAEIEIRSRQPVYDMLGISANGLKTKSKIEKLKIKVDKDVASQMINEIGALILEFKNK